MKPTQICKRALRDAGFSKTVVGEAYVSDNTAESQSTLRRWKLPILSKTQESCIDAKTLEWGVVQWPMLVF